MNTENKLIAEFMGYKLARCNSGFAWDIGESIPSKDHLFPIQGVLHTGRELKFHSSWDWLMPVVEKIRFNEFVENFNINITCDVFIEGEFPEIEIYCDNKVSTLEATYKAVVEFIKWYNENN